MGEHEFTIEQAIRIQRNQLDRWRVLLKPPVFKALEEKAIKSNIGVIDPNDIMRGTRFDEFIANYPVDLDKEREELLQATIAWMRKEYEDYKAECDGDAEVREYMTGDAFGEIEGLSFNNEEWSREITNEAFDKMLELES